jgi:hypothetical protein
MGKISHLLRGKMTLWMEVLWMEVGLEHKETMKIGLKRQEY